MGGFAAVAGLNFLLGIIVFLLSTLLDLLTFGLVIGSGGLSWLLAWVSESLFPFYSPPPKLFSFSL